MGVLSEVKNLFLAHGVTILGSRYVGEAGAPSHPPSQDIGLAVCVLGDGPEVGSPFTYSRRLIGAVIMTV